MNRRDLFKRLAAIGIVAAVPESLQRYWQLDQTMTSGPRVEMESMGLIVAPPPRNWTVVMTVSPHGGVDAEGMVIGNNVFTRRRDLETVDDPRWFYSREKVIA